MCVVGEVGRSGHGGHHRHSSPWPYGFTETWEDTLHPQSNRTASGLLPVPAPTLGFILRERVPSELLSGCGCGLLCCSPPPPPRPCRGEGLEAGAQGNGLRVGRRHLGYRRQVGADLQPKYDRGCSLPRKESAPKPFC